MNLNIPFLTVSSIICIICYAVFTYLNKQKQDFKSLKLIITSLIFILIHLLTGFVGIILTVMPFLIYIGIQILSLLTGTIFYHKVIKPFYPKFNFKVLSTAILYLFVIGLSAVCFTFIFDLFNVSGLGWYYSTAFFAFIIPFFFYNTFEAILYIPVPIFKVWYYPEYPVEIDLDDLDLNRVKVVELEFLKNLGETSTTNFKAKAPEELRFGDWFSMFIQNYNQKYEDTPIVVKDKYEAPFGWVFYIKPGFFGSKKFVDFDLTITQNALNEKMVIVCKRVENK